MGLDLIELLFSLVGKFIWKAVQLIFGGKTKLSEGGYEAIGFIFIILAALLIFLIWGYFNV